MTIDSKNKILHLTADELMKAKDKAAIIKLNEDIHKHKLEKVVIEGDIEKEALLDFTAELFSLPNYLKELVVIGNVDVQRQELQDRTHVEKIGVYTSTLKNSYIRVHKNSVTIGEQTPPKDNILGKEEAEEIARILTADITEITIEGKLTKNDVEQLFKILDQHPRLTKLSIRGDISSVRQELQDKLTQNRTLTGIHPILDDPTDIKFVTNALANHPNITALDLTDFPIGDKPRALPLLCEALIETTTLMELRFNNNTKLKVTENSLLNIALKENTSLSKIVINGKEVREMKDPIVKSLLENPYISHEIEVELNGRKSVEEKLSKHISDNQKKQTLAKNPELMKFIKEIIEVDNLISSNKGTNLNNTKNKLADILYDRLAKVMEDTHPQKSELDKLMQSDSKTKKKLSHAIIDALSELELKDAKFNYQSFTLKSTYILDKIAEFINGVVMLACGDKGKTLDKLFKNQTELIVQDPTRFIESLDKAIKSETKPGESFDDALNYAFEKSKRNKWTSKVKNEKPAGELSV